MAASPPAATPAAPPPAKEKDIDVVYVRSYPKVIFLYPSAIIALIFGLIAAVAGGVETDRAQTLGVAFMLLFLFNVLVISFDFSNMVTFAIVMTVTALLLLLYVVSRSWGFIEAFGRFLSSLDIRMSAGFYFTYAIALGVIYAVIWFIRRFFYWEIKSNEILYHQGLFGDVERHDTRGLKQTKHISDIFELLLLRSGQLVLHVQGLQEPYVISNVPNIARVERAIQQITSRQAVEIETR